MRVADKERESQKWKRLNLKDRNFLIQFKIELDHWNVKKITSRRSLTQVWLNGAYPRRCPFDSSSLRTKALLQLRPDPCLRPNEGSENATDGFPMSHCFGDDIAQARSGKVRDNRNFPILALTNLNFRFVIVLDRRSCSMTRWIATSAKKWPKTWPKNTRLTIQGLWTSDRLKFLARNFKIQSSNIFLEMYLRDLLVK